MKLRDSYEFTEFDDIDMDIEEHLLPKKDIVVDRADIKYLVRRRNAMKILLFLYYKNSDYTVAELSNRLGLSYDITYYNVKILLKIGIVERIVSYIDGRYKCCRVIRCEALEKIKNYYLRLVGYVLSKAFLNEEGIPTNDLLSNEQFIERCKDYFPLNYTRLGIEALKSNKSKCTVKGNILIRRDILPTVPLETKSPPSKATAKEVFEALEVEDVEEKYDEEEEGFEDLVEVE